VSGSRTGELECHEYTVRIRAVVTERAAVLEARALIQAVCRSK
jgi:hypothetical protein